MVGNLLTKVKRIPTCGTGSDFLFRPNARIVKVGKSLSFPKTTDLAGVN